jgi:hypothetical protein
VRQHSIRRYELMLVVAAIGAELVQHAVRDIVHDGQFFVIDGQYRCHLISASGTCPVYRALFPDALPRERAHQPDAGAGFPYEWRDPDCLWFFENGLPGYVVRAGRAAG